MKRLFILLFVITFALLNTHSQNGQDIKVSKDIQGNTVIETNNKKIKIGKDIMGKYFYEVNNRNKATLKKDVLDRWIYEDDNRNEIKFSKEFWDDIIKDHRGNEEKAFKWLINMNKNLKNYKEEYKVDILDRLQFENNQRESASLRKDIFDKYIYEDSKRNKIEFDEKQWKRFCRKHRSDKKAFMELIQQNLFR